MDNYSLSWPVPRFLTPKRMGLHGHQKLIGLGRRALEGHHRHFGCHRGLGSVGNLALKLSNLLVALSQRHRDLLTAACSHLHGRLRLLLLVVGPRVTLLPPPLLFALRLRTVHADRFPHPTDKGIACPRIHVGNRPLVRHKWKGRGGAEVYSAVPFFMWQSMACKSQ